MKTHLETVEQLITDGLYTQALDELQNCKNELITMNVDFENIRGKAMDKFPDEELFVVDFEGVIQTILA